MLSPASNTHGLLDKHTRDVLEAVRSYRPLSLSLLIIVTIRSSGRSRLCLCLLVRICYPLCRDLRLTLAQDSDGLRVAEVVYPTT